MLRIIGITMGDPAGIGPEIIIKMLANQVFTDFQIIVIGDFSILQERATHLKINIPIIRIQHIPLHKELHLKSEPQILVYDVVQTNRDNFQLGHINPHCGEAAYQCIYTAVQLHLDQKIDAIVTAPICKESLQQAGHQFNGHTELLAYLTNTQHFRMLLSTKKIKVIHVTTHLSLQKMLQTLTVEKIYQTIKLGNQHLIRLGIENPRIGLCGLNPHAGENGLFGTEEAEIIIPAIEEALKENINVQGPIPGDVIFRQAYQGEFDLLVAHYHDQGHIPLKMIAFDEGVNVTVGLPIIRTSVDHGTAFDIADQMIADYVNLNHAVNYAFQMIQK